MRNLKMAILTLMACAAVTVQAQTKDVKLLAQPVRPLPHIYSVDLVKDEVTGEESAIYPSTENAWIKDTVWVENVPLQTDLSFMKEGQELVKTLRDHSNNNPYTFGYWRLTEEGDETVLHCYLWMPRDVLTNIWLASEETAILDKETGIQYRAKRTVPECCWKKHFGVKAPRGSLLDFQIYFPRLPKATRKIAIYGVPGWGMRGLDVKLKRSGKQVEKYDAAPQLQAPRLVREANNYDKDNHSSWAIYTDPHLIKPVEGENVMALWRTPEATYIATAHEQNWMREYYGFHPDARLIDERGNRYKLKEVQGLPSDDIFWMEGNSGDYLAYVSVFEPLPLDVETIDYIVPDGEPFEMWGASWEGETLRNLSVQELRANQPLFQYHKRQVVEK